VEYRSAKRFVWAAIRKAKVRCWQELITSIDEDLWSLPYRLVMGRLRRSTPGLTETLDTETLGEVLNSLFPTGETHDSFGDWHGVGVPLDDCNVSVEEVRAAIRAGRCGASPAPGPDGIPILVWRSIPSDMITRLADLFSACLREGNFPSQWKCAKLVLIPKDNSPPLPGRSIKVRPICLLNEVGKIFEKYWWSDLNNSWRIIPPHFRVSIWVPKGSV